MAKRIIKHGISEVDSHAADVRVRKVVENILEDSAQIYISWKDGTDWVELQNQIFIHPTTGKLLNYFANENVPEDYDSEFKLTIVSKDGDIFRSTTKILHTKQKENLTIHSELPIATLYSFCSIKMSQKPLAGEEGSLRHKTPALKSTKSIISPFYVSPR